MPISLESKIKKLDELYILIQDDKYLPLIAVVILLMMIASLVIYRDNFIKGNITLKDKKYLLTILSIWLIPLLLLPLFITNLVDANNTDTTYRELGLSVLEELTDETNYIVKEIKNIEKEVQYTDSGGCNWLGLEETEHLMCKKVVFYSDGKTKEILYYLTEKYNKTALEEGQLVKVHNIPKELHTKLTDILTRPNKFKVVVEDYVEEKHGSYLFRELDNYEKPTKITLRSEIKRADFMGNSTEDGNWYVGIYND